MNRAYLKYIIPAVIGIGLLAWLFSGSDAGGADSAFLITPERGPFQVTVTVTGELRAKNSKEIKGPAGLWSMRIHEVKISKLVPEGTVVAEGDFVAELDRAPLNDKIVEAKTEFEKAEQVYIQVKLDTTLTLSEARNNLLDAQYAVEEARLNKENSAYEAPAIRRQAEITHERAVRTFEQGKKNYETKVQQAVAKIREAEASLSQVRQQLDRMNKLADEFSVLAPAPGMVIYERRWGGEKLVVGSTVEMWDPVVAQLPDLSVMESIVYVNEVDIQKVRAEQQVNITLDAMSDKTLEGIVSEVGNMGEQRPNSDSKVFEVIIQVKAADSTLRPAMTTGNTIITAELANALFVPLECVHTQDSITYVYQKKGFSAVRKQVEIGLVNDNHAVIRTGVNEDDRLYLSIPEAGEELPLVYLEAIEREAPPESQELGQR